jgi:uncharacterized protein with HEPN domain
MSVPSAGELIAHMRDAARQATAYVEGMGRSDFLSDKRTQQAVILNLIILGEAATKLMERFPDVTAAHPEIAWRSMRGMRNRIAHGYYEIDLETVWQTVASALPQLVGQLDALDRSIK